MAETVVSSFFWRSWNPFQKLQHRWGFYSQEFKTFVTSIQNCSLEVIQNQQLKSPASYSLLHRALAYLGDNPDPKVEAIVRTKFQTATPQAIRNYIEDLVEFSTIVDMPKILMVAEKLFQECSMKEVFQIDLEKARIEHKPKIRGIYRAILDLIRDRINTKTGRNPTSLDKLNCLRENCAEVYRSILISFEAEEEKFSEEKKICLKMIFEHLKTQYNAGKSYEELQQIDEDLIDKILVKAIPEIDFNHVQNPPRSAANPSPAQQIPPFQHTLFSLLHYARSLSVSLSCIIFYYLYHYIWTLTKAFGVPTYEKPASLIDAQTQVSFYQTSFFYIRWFTEWYLQLFSTRKKAVIISGASAGALFLLYRLFNKIQPDSPDFFKQWASILNQGTLADSDQTPFRDLTREAREGSLEPFFGRENELQHLITFLSSPDSIISPRVMMIVGETGVGKSRLIEGLALKIVRKETASLNGKSVIIPDRNASSEKSSSEPSKNSTSINETLQKIKGKEIDHILYIRRAHQLDRNTLLRLVEKVKKTHLRVILSTTPIEYPSLANIEELMEQSFPMPLESLDRVWTYNILMTMITDYNATHISTINPHIAHHIATESQVLEGAEPRRSIQILVNIMCRLNSSIPRKPRLLELFEKKHLQLSEDYSHAQDLDVTYPLTLDGRAHKEKLRLLGEKTQELQHRHSDKIKLQHRANDFLRKKKSLERRYARVESKLSKPNANRTQLENRLYFWLCVLGSFKQQEDCKIRETLERLNYPVDLINLKPLNIFSNDELQDYFSPFGDSVYPLSISPQMVREYCKNLHEHQQQQKNPFRPQYDPSRRERRAQTPGQSPEQSHASPGELEERLGRWNITLGEARET